MLLSLPWDAVDVIARLLPLDDQARLACVCRDLNHRLTGIGSSLHTWRSRVREIVDGVIGCGASDDFLWFHGDANAYFCIANGACFFYVGVENGVSNFYAVRDCHNTAPPYYFTRVVVPPAPIDPRMRAFMTFVHDALDALPSDDGGACSVFLRWCYTQFRSKSSKSSQSEAMETRDT